MSAGSFVRVGAIARVAGRNEEGEGGWEPWAALEPAKGPGRLGALGGFGASKRARSAGQEGPGQERAALGSGADGSAPLLIPIYSGAQPLGGAVATNGTTGMTASAAAHCGLAAAATRSGSWWPFKGIGDAAKARQGGQGFGKQAVRSRRPMMMGGAESECRWRCRRCPLRCPLRCLSVASGRCECQVGPSKWFCQVGQAEGR